MKITCQSCQAKYTIADEKVAGKTVKIKCKKCGATIVVSGDAAAAAPAPEPQAFAPAYGGGAVAASSPPGDDDEGDGATRVFAEGGPPPGGPDEWTVNISDDDQRTLTGPQIVMEFQRGSIKPDTYVWKDGMADWSPISDVPELMRLVSVPAPRPAAGGPAMRPAAGMPAATAAIPAAQPAPAIHQAPAQPDNGLSGTMIMNEPMMSPLAALSPAAAASVAAGAPAAARRGGKSPAVDLFASGQHERSPAAPGVSSGSGPAASLNASGSQLGERNENSVLFSISALTAAAGVKGGDDPFDLAGPPRHRGGGRGNVDDIMNLGGGMSGAPMLAPPPLLAPVVEAPPPPPTPPPQNAIPVGPQGPMMSAVPAMRTDQLTPPQKSKAPLIFGLLATVAIFGGGAVFFATRSSGPTPGASGGSDSTATVANTTAPTATTAPTMGAAPATNTPTATAADTGAPAPSTAPTTAGTPDPGKPAAHGGPNPGHAPDPRTPATPDPKPVATPDPKPVATPDPPPAKTADAKPDPGGGGGKEFDRAAAMSALSGASGGARGCKKADGPTGTARVSVTFAPSGSVTSASVDGPPFAGTPVGGCIAAAFRSAHVPSFDGGPITVHKSITIN